MQRKRGETREEMRASREKNSASEAILSTMPMSVISFVASDLRRFFLSGRRCCGGFSRWPLRAAECRPRPGPGTFFSSGLSSLARFFLSPRQQRPRGVQLCRRKALAALDLRPAAAHARG